MSERTVDLALVLPRASDCTGCVDEVSRELARLEGIETVEPDLTRGLLRISHDATLLSDEDVVRLARRIGTATHCAAHCPFPVHDHGPLDLTAPGAPARERRLLHVTGMDCADCAAKLQNALRKEEGVAEADVNFGAATLSVVLDPSVTDLDRVFRAVRRLGYDTVERRAAAGGSRAGEEAGAAAGATAPESGASPAATPASRSLWSTDRRARLVIASGVLVAAGFLADLLAPAAAPFLFAAAALIGGGPVARAAFFSLRARQVDINVLMSIAIVGAMAIGAWSEAGLVAFLFSLGTVLQTATLERTRRAISGLMDLTPPVATVIRDGAEVVVPAAEVAVGEIIVARPGERLAVDGVVLAGVASANEAAITGEPLPVTKGPGDTVFAGSVLEGGALRVRTTATAADTTVAKIVHLVEEAQATRAPAQAIVDRFAARYTPAVIALAAAVVLVPPLVFGGAWGTWIYRGLALLIVSCPCALVISTPVSILAALGNATRHGVLVKGGTYLEQAAYLRVVAFDKTGTLTEGRPEVSDVVALNGWSRDDVLRLAAAVERDSEHALARAIVVAAGGDGHREVRRFRSLAGLGVRAEVDGRQVAVGRPELLGPHASDPALVASLARLEAEGKTAVAVGDERGALGVIAVSDPLRPMAPAALAGLREAGVDRLVMLTGDNAATAAAVAKAAGVDDVRAGLMPADKVAAVHELRERHGAVAMVGDGVNDAPALAAADLGIAMGAAGTDAALDTADIALMGDDLTALPLLLRLSRRTGRIIRQNIAVSIVIKAVFLVLAPLGLTSLWLAVFADMGTSLLVTGNGLRLHRD